MDNIAKAADLRNPIRGARDFYPKDLAIRNWLFAKWRESARLFGYEEIDGPSLESFELFAAKSGEELVNNQTYSLTDRDERKLAIRPELTPTYSRLVAKKQNELTFPLRWMMFGEVWRYEKPQAGRARDFWQWELNIVGGQEDLADAEVITIAAKALQAVGLTQQDIVFRINDRRFVQETLLNLDFTQEEYLLALKLVDKKERLSPEEFQKWALELGLSTDKINALEKFLENPGWQNNKKLASLFSLLDEYGVSDYVVYDPLIVRGLSYYTGTVFECFDRNKKFRSIFGGGRFDDLVQTFGGGQIPACGFAIGDVVITLLLESLGKTPKLQTSPTKVLVTIFSPDLLKKSLETTSMIRINKLNCEMYPDSNVKLDKQLKYADQKGIPFAIIIGPDEAAKNLVTLKNLSTKTQKTATLKECIKLIGQL